MGKKNKKRFNQVLDIDFQFSNTSVMDGGAPPDINLTKEKLEKLQRIKSELPSAPQAVRLEEEVSRVSETGPFRMTLHNVPFQAQRRDIYEFLAPVVPACVSIDESGQNRGFCHVEFTSKPDMIAAMERNGDCLQGRRITMRIADADDSRMAFGNSYSSYNRRQDYRPNAGFSTHRQGEQATGWVRRSMPKPEAFNPPPPPSAQRSEPAPISERPVLRIKPRSKPFNESERDSFVQSERNAAIFGAAKPVDIVAKERELEEQMRKASLQDAQTGDDRRRPEESEAKPSVNPQQRANAWAKPLVQKRD